MRAYTITTLQRYINVLVRMLVEFRDIGFSEETINTITSAASHEILRIINEQEKLG